MENWTPLLAGRSGRNWLVFWGGKLQMNFMQIERTPNYPANYQYITLWFLPIWPNPCLPIISIWVIPRFNLTYPSFNLTPHHLSQYDQSFFSPINLFFIPIRAHLPLRSVCQSVSGVVTLSTWPNWTLLYPHLPWRASSMNALQRQSLFPEITIWIETGLMLVIRIERPPSITKFPYQ